MFEDRMISVLAYNLETILAEKMETVINRGALNTRLRDFFDIYLLENTRFSLINHHTFKQAFNATVNKRGTTTLLEDGDKILQEIYDSEVMQKLWRDYQNKYDQAKGITWDNAIQSIRKIYSLTTE